MSQDSNTPKNTQLNEKIAIQQMAIQEKQTDNAFKHAMQTLQDQKEVALKSIDVQKTNTKYSFLVLIVAFITILLVIYWSLKYQHPDLVTDIIKYLVYGFGSGGIGYSICAVKHRKKD